MVKERMKKRPKEETTPIPRIYHEALQEVAQHENRETIAPVLPTFSSMQSSLYRKRCERLPPLPRLWRMALQTKEASRESPPQYLWSCHPLQIRAGSHRSKYHAVGCRRTVNQEEEEIQTSWEKTGNNQREVRGRWLHPQWISQSSQPLGVILTVFVSCN